MYEYIGILLGARPILHFSRIKVNMIITGTQKIEGARNLK
jgi:hypothetical protein